ncbi:MAG: hypothetical protein J6B86_06675, partial [Clostridia bacterium]|nr:hypothetical protein [Clostridia bacterium]
MKKFSAISRIIAFALVLCLCSAFVPVMTFADEVTPGTITITPTEGEAVILDEDITEAQIGDGVATYDVANNKVTLNALTVAQIVFAMNGDYTVEIVGVNNVTNSAGVAVQSTSGNMTLTGTGTLNATYTAGTAISVTGNITINGVTVNAYASANGLSCSGTVLIDGADTNVMVYSSNNRALNANKVVINDGTVKNFYLDEEGTEVISKYGITATTNGMFISGGNVVAKATANSPLFSAKNGMFITGGTVDVEAPGNCIRIDAGNLEISGENTVVTTNAASSNKSINVASGDLKISDGATVTAEGNSGAIIVVGTVYIQNSTVKSTGRTGQGAITGSVGIVIDNSYVEASSTGNTVYSASTITISGSEYNEETGEGTYVYAYGREYAFYSGSGLTTVNGGTVVGEAKPNAANYGIIGGAGYTQNGGDVTLNVLDDNAHPVFDIRKNNFTLNGGSLAINAAYSEVFYFRVADSAIVLNGGRLTGTVDSFITQAKASNANSVTVSPYADVDMTIATAAFTGANITVNAEGVTWEEGKELTATATAIKTIPLVTFDTTFDASVTLNGAAQAGQTVGLYQDGEEIATAVTNANGIATFSLTGVSVDDVLTYTLKQIATDADGYVYDVAEREISVLVNEDGTTTVTGDNVFENIYKFITVTTEEDAVTFGDTEGDATATTVEIGGGTVSYDADTGALVLNNVTAVSIVINVRKDVALEIVGENNVINAEGNRIFRVYNGSVTVDGEGSLNVSSKEYSINIDNGSWTQNGATVNSVATTGPTILWTKGDIVFNGGTLTGSSVSYYGVYATGGITITRGTIDVVAAANVICAGTEDLEISGGTVTAETVTDNSSYGDYAIRANEKDLIITGGTVTAKAIKTALGDNSAFMTIGPDVKLVASSVNGSVSNARSVVADGVRFVTGKSFDNNSGEVETLVGNETDYNLPGEGTVVVNVTLNGEADNGREVQLWQGDTLVETQTASEEG